MVEIIAEIGSSPAPAWHFRDWCRAAATAGATKIKAQLFRADHFPEAERASKKPLEFPRERLEEFVYWAHGSGLDAGVSVFDADAVELAAKHCDFLKLAAREQSDSILTQDAFDSAQRARITVYRSVSEACYVTPNAWLWFGGSLPSLYFVTLWTAQEYPRPTVKALADVLRMRRLGVQGYSSHTRGWLDCWLAAKLGAQVVEKHIALLPNDIEVDHSLLPAEFRKMTMAING